MRQVIHRGSREIMRRKRIEESHQVAFAGWFRTQYPKYRNLITLPSFGENIGARRMNRLKQMGLTPGWPDIFIAVPRDFHTQHKMAWDTWGELSNGDVICCGLFIEMKSETGIVTEAQAEIHYELRYQGYRVEVCWSWDEAKAVVMQYMG